MQWNCVQFTGLNFSIYESRTYTWYVHTVALKPCVFL